MALKQQNCYTKILPISNPLIFLHASILTHDAQLQSTLKMFKDVKRMMQVMLNKSIPRDITIVHSSCLILFPLFL